MLGAELGLGFLVNIGNFSVPQAANFSSSKFYLVLRVEPELHNFFSGFLLPLHFELSLNANHRVWSYSVLLPLLQGGLQLPLFGVRLVEGVGRFSPVLVQSQSQAEPVSMETFLSTATKLP